MKTNRKNLIRRAPLALALAVALASPSAFAGGPTGGVFRLPGTLTGGNIDQTNPNVTEVNVTTPGTGVSNVAVIDWGTFNIDADHTVNFNNSTGGSQAVINVDLQGSPSLINGHINTTGNTTSVLVVNPNGVQVGAGAQINTSGAFQAAAGTVSLGAGQVDINLSQAPLIVDQAATINAGTAAGPSEFVDGVQGVGLRSDGSTATLPVSWTGQETNLQILTTSGDGNFTTNAGWRTEPGSAMDGSARTVYTLTGSQSNTVNAASDLTGVGIYQVGIGALTVNATDVNASYIRGNGSTTVNANNINYSLIDAGVDGQINVTATGTINGGTVIGASGSSAVHGGVNVSADTIDNAWVSGGPGGAPGFGQVNVQARNVNQLRMQSRNGQARLFGFDSATNIYGTAFNDPTGARQAFVLDGNAGATINGVQVDPVDASNDPIVVLNGQNISNVQTNSEIQVNIQDGGSLSNANLDTTRSVVISSGANAAISNLTVANASDLSMFLGAGSTVQDSTLIASSMDLEGGTWTRASIRQQGATGLAYLSLEGIANSDLSWAAPLYLETSGSIIDTNMSGTNDFTIVAPLLRGGMINAQPVDMSNPNSKVIGELYLGRMEGSAVVVGDLYVEVDSVGRNPDTGLQSGATVYRGNLVVRMRSADGSIWSVRGGRLDIVATENFDNSSVFITGSNGGTITADSISGGNFTYDQPRVDDPAFEPAPAPIGNGTFVINARTINGANLTAIDSNFTINASESITNTGATAYYNRGDASQTQLTINAPLVDGVNVNNFTVDRFGSVNVNADTVQNSTIIGTAVAINGRDLINTVVQAFDGRLDVLMSGQIDQAQLTVRNGDADIQAATISNTSGTFNSSTVSVQADSIDNMQMGGAAGALTVNAGSINNTTVNLAGTTVNMTADSATGVTINSPGQTTLAFNTANNIQVNNATGINASGIDWANSSLIASGDVRVDLDSLSDSAINAGGDVSGRADTIDRSTVSGQNIDLTVAQVQNQSTLQAVQNLKLSGGAIVISDSKLLADVLAIQASGDLTIQGASTLDAVSRIAMQAAGKLGIGEDGGNILITSERIAGTADRIVIGDNAALIVRTPSAATGSDQIQINGNATYTGDANQQATSGNFYAFGFHWTIIGDQVVLLDPPTNGTASGEAGITLTAANGVEVNGGTLYAGDGQEAPPIVVPPVDPPPPALVPPSVRVQIVRPGDVETARYTDAVLLIPAQLKARQGGLAQ